MLKLFMNYKTKKQKNGGFTSLLSLCGIILVLKYLWNSKKCKIEIKTLLEIFFVT